VAEAIGTAGLVMAVVGSGIMGERLAGGNTAIALIANSAATGCALFALIVALRDLSGAHFNPLVTLCALFEHSVTLRSALGYLLAQLGGAAAGVALAHAMFGFSIFLPSTTVRSGAGQWVAEAVATFGLVMVVRGTARHSALAVAASVGSYIAVAYWCTASTAFANPAATVARALTDTFAGIRLEDAVPFVVAQTIGAVAAIGVAAWLFPRAQARPSQPTAAIHSGSVTAAISVPVEISSATGAPCPRI
jgi:glycerol uptake facilitator-like aquaporin